jgi:hypothetical protein
MACNRLFEFIKGLSGSATFSDALMTTTDGLHERFGAVDTLASKGVHASVAQYEAEFCALNTYVLAGEIVRLRHLLGRRGGEGPPAAARGSRYSREAG